MGFLYISCHNDARCFGQLNRVESGHQQWESRSCSHRCWLTLKTYQQDSLHSCYSIFPFSSHSGKFFSTAQASAMTPVSSRTSSTRHLARWAFQTTNLLLTSPPLYQIQPRLQLVILVPPTLTSFNCCQLRDSKARMNGMNMMDWLPNAPQFNDTKYNIFFLFTTLC